ncbi:hypothetical protein H9P43_002544 [Blastocladiella emersonii ATCC 22665]|nr:hypothetical protein H9P43_002544 [Blastocladiella emersonii ATCC 22665]
MARLNAIRATGGGWKMFESLREMAKTTQPQPEHLNETITVLCREDSHMNAEDVLQLAPGVGEPRVTYTLASGTMYFGKPKWSIPYFSLMAEASDAEPWIAYEHLARAATWYPDTDQVERLHQEVLEKRDPRLLTATYYENLICGLASWWEDADGYDVEAGIENPAVVTALGLLKEMVERGLVPSERAVEYMLQRAREAGDEEGVRSIHSILEKLPSR